MWRYKPFVPFLYQLADHWSVGEVIIFNNAIRDTPPLNPHPKIKLINFPENIKVNPAWNYSVSQSQYENLFILNDDVIFDLGVLGMILEFLQQGRVIMANLAKSDDQSTLGHARLVKYQPGHRVHHMGCMMFIHRDDWYPIPAGLEINYGDSWIWDYMLAKYNENYLLENAFIDTPESVTTLLDREHIYLRETELVRGMWDYYIKLLSKK